MSRRKKKYTVQHEGFRFEFDTLAEANQAMRQFEAQDAITTTAAIAATPPPAVVQGASGGDSAQYAAILALFEQIDQDEQDIEMLLLSL